MLPLQRLRHGALLSIGISLVGVPPASAQGFFDSLFGRPSPPPAAAPAYSPGPASAPSGGSSLTSAASNPAAPMSGFRGAAFCVRLCDGRFFPMQPHANVTPVALCQALCPASDTRVFHGSDIAQATSSDGGRYSGLKTAYQFRKSLVAGCTCNGKDAFGLAPIDVDKDPTLRSGDLVARADSASQTGSTPVAAGPANVRAASSVASAPGAASAPPNYPVPASPAPVRAQQVVLRTPPPSSDPAPSVSSNYYRPPPRDLQAPTW
jgi:hypothetical protein